MAALTTPRRLLARRGVAFAGAATLLAYMGLEGGSYDIVPRQQVALGAWIAIAICFALGVLPRGRPSRLAAIPLAAGLALVAWVGLSLIWTDSAERTWDELARTLGYLGLMGLAVTALNRHTFRAAAAGVSVAGVIVVGVSVTSRLSPSVFPQALDVARLFSDSDRLNFPLDYWNAVGTWGAMTVAMGLAWSAHARTGLLRAVALAATPAAGLAIYLSYSRGGMLAAGVALIAALVLSRNRWTVFVHAVVGCAGTALVILVVRDNPEIADATGGAGGGAVALALAGAAALCAGAVFLTWILRADEARLPERIPVWATRAVVAGLVLVALVAARGTISSAWDEFRSDDSQVTAEDPAARLTSAGGNRNDIWNSALDAYRSEPLIGIGPGTFEFWWEVEGDDDEYVRDAHSLYLEVLAETGIVGLVLLLTLLGGSLAVAVAARRGLERDSDLGANAAMVGAFVVFCVSAGVDWMWEETALGAMALGGLAIAMAGGSERLRRDGRRGPIGRPGVRGLIAAGAVAAAIVQVPGLASTDRVRASEDALADGDYATARALAEDAVDAEPWSATAHAQLAIAARAGGDLRTAREEADEAIRREPLNWRWPLLLSRIQVDAGDVEDAIETFKEGRPLAPNLPFYSPFSAYGAEIYSKEQLTRFYDRKQAAAAARAAKRGD